MASDDSHNEMECKYWTADPKLLVSLLQTLFNGNPNMDKYSNCKLIVGGN